MMRFTASLSRLKLPSVAGNLVDPKNDGDER
jgi:hypothetical protein